MAAPINMERTQSLINAIGDYLQKCNGEVDIEACIESIKETVPDVSPEEAIGLLQLYLSPMGEGEDMFFGEDGFGWGEEDFGGSPFNFQLE